MKSYIGRQKLKDALFMLMVAWLLNEILVY